jgi:hypothetical protein
MNKQRMIQYLKDQHCQTWADVRYVYTQLIDGCQALNGWYLDSINSNDQAVAEMDFTSFVLTTLHPLEIATEGVIITEINFLRG